MAVFAHDGNREKVKIENEIIKEAGITRRFLEYLLKGERNAGGEIAMRIQKASGIHWTHWVVGNGKQRRRLWGMAIEIRIPAI